MTIRPAPRRSASLGHARRVGAALLAITVLTPSLPAASQAGREGTGGEDAAQPVLIDGGSGAVLRSLQSAYRSRRIAERIRVSVSSEGVERADELVLTSDPGVALSIDLGLITVFASPQQLIAIHELNSDQYWSAQVSGGDVCAAIERSLPPLPLPQIALAWRGGAPAGDAEIPLPDRLTPYDAPGPWIIEQATDESGTVTVSLAALREEGSSGNSSIRAVITADDARLTGARFEEAQTGAVITTEVERLLTEPVATSDPEALIAMPDVSGRERLESIGMLLPRPGDIAVGERFPSMLLSADPASGHAPGASGGGVAGPAAVLLSLVWTDTLDRPRDAFTLLQDEAPEVNLYRVAVVDSATGDLDFALRTARERLGEVPLWFSMSPAHTLRRFSARVPAVIVVVDEQQIVRRIIEVRPIRGGTGFDDQVPILEPRQITGAVKEALGLALSSQDQPRVEPVGPSPVQP